MDDATIAVIVEASRALPPEEQGQYIARQAIARSLLAMRPWVSERTLLDCLELSEWLAPFMGGPEPPRITHVAWGRHLLSGGRHG